MKATGIFKNFVINAVNCLMMTLTLGTLNVVRGGSFPPLSANIVSYLFSYCVINLITTFIPGEKAGVAFAKAIGAKEGTFGFDVAVCAILNTVNTIFILPTMTWFVNCFCNGQPASTILPTFLSNVPFAWVATFIPPLIIGNAAGKWAEKFVKQS